MVKRGKRFIFLIVFLVLLIVSISNFVSAQFCAGSMDCGYVYDQSVCDYMYGGYCYWDYNSYSCLNKGGSCPNLPQNICTSMVGCYWCYEDCDIYGYVCGSWNFCGTNVNCGTCSTYPHTTSTICGGLTSPPQYIGKCLIQGCSSGWANCDSSPIDPNGCETQLGTNSNCAYCGNSCGSGNSCQGGTCACAPNCAGKECGSDGCGGSCGTCSTFPHSNMGCGTSIASPLTYGKCYIASCDSGWGNCDNDMLDTDGCETQFGTNSNCAYCGNSCGIGYSCQSSTCQRICTANSYTDCYNGDSYWYDSCDVRGSLYDDCSSAETCSSGSCVTTCIPNDYLDCYNGDGYHFDSCGNRGSLYDDCSSGEGCSEGLCTTTCTPNDYTDCYNGDSYWYDSCDVRGSLYDDCSSAETCSSGSCVTTCTSNDYTNCYNNDVYWYNSCGTRGSIYDDCSSTEACSGGECVSTCTSYDYTGCYNNDAYWYDSCGVRGSLDEDCNDYNSCTTDICSSGSCDYISYGCSDGDGCCGEGCTYANDDDCSTTCGDGSCSGEDCDSCYEDCMTDTTSYLGCSSNNVYWYDNCGARQSVYDYCDSNQYCSNGECTSSCTSYDYTDCYNDDIYWYDSCGTREGIYEYCNSDQYCSGGECISSCASYDYLDCYNNNVYWYDSCGVRGSLDEYCDDNNGCTTDICSSGLCNYIPFGCSDGDGCCGEGCTYANDDDCSTTCGDGSCSGEDCDSCYEDCMTDTTSYLGCSSNNVYWYDNCGARQSVYDYCDSNQYCSNGECGYSSGTPGNGIIEPGEECDDGNTNNGDGCDSNGNIENGWDCTGEPSICTPTGAVIGNGIIEGSEECDDGNTNNGDGCSSVGDIEPGWDCTGEPSICTPTGAVIGNGIIEGSEECDDGNTNNGDGCDSNGNIENGWDCTGEPSICTSNCHLTAAYWDETATVAGNTIRLYVEGTNCNGKTISFTVMEKDGFLNADDPVNTNPASITYGSPNTYGVWTVEWQSDNEGGQSDPPEYYFIARVGGTSDTIESSTALEDMVQVFESLDVVCLGVNYCANYNIESFCESDLCAIGNNDAPSTITCGMTFDNISGCYDDTTCGCGWNAALGKCGADWNTVSGCSGENLSIGTCQYNENSDDTCDDDGMLTRSLVASWLWSVENPLHQDPLGKEQKCQSIDDTISCPASAQVSFFGTYQLIIAIVLVGIIYLIYALGKKKNSKHAKKHSKIKGRRK